ncbi:hypothetical protein Tco_0415917 [Tanacetum coccineum]
MQLARYWDVTDINTMPYRIYEQLGREDMKKVDRGITMINHTQAEAMGILTNVLCQVGVTTLIAKFLSRGIASTSSCMEFLLWEGFVTADAKSRMGCDGEIHDMLRIRLREAGSDEEIFTSVAWIKAFNINEPIFLELYHEFYSTYKFDEVSANDELQTKKIIKFRLGGRAYSLTLLEFAQRLGLYQAVELEEEEENLGLSRSHTSTIKNPILRVIHKMITYGLCQRTTGLLTEDVVRSLSALIYCRDLDTITLRDLINSEGMLIPKDPQPIVPRVGIFRPPRASMQDLYDRMGRMEIRQHAIEQMKYRQSYNWDMY